MSPKGGRAVAGDAAAGGIKGDARHERGPEWTQVSAPTPSWSNPASDDEAEAEEDLADYDEVKRGALLEQLRELMLGKLDKMQQLGRLTEGHHAGKSGTDSTLEEQQEEQYHQQEQYQQEQQKSKFVTQKQQ